MKKANPKTRNLLEKAITIDQLPAVVPRPVAADFSVLSKRSSIRAEKEGRLKPIRRGPQSVGYLKEDFLRFLGLSES